MDAREALRPDVGKGPNETFFARRLIIDDHVTDQKRSQRRLRVSHVTTPLVNLANLAGHCNQTAVAPPA